MQNQVDFFITASYVKQNNLNHHKILEQAYKKNMIIDKDVGGGGYSSASGLMATHTGHDSSTSKYRTFSGQFLDAPSTTSAVTYTPYVKVNQNTIKFGDNGMYSAILMEVLG